MSNMCTYTAVTDAVNCGHKRVESDKKRDIRTTSQVAAITFLSLSSVSGEEIIACLTRPNGVSVFRW